jgi:hypothetical protein
VTIGENMQPFDCASEREKPQLVAVNWKLAVLSQTVWAVSYYVILLEKG